MLVDDAQWLDRATSDALLFAAKRLVADSAAILLAVREGGERSFEAPALEYLELRPLRCEEAERLLSGEAIAPAVVRELCTATHGNPLALLEVTRQLSDEQLAGREPLPHPVPAGQTLERAFTWRAETLPDEARSALVVVAVALADDVETIAAALESLGIEPSALEAAEDADLVTIADHRIAFRHPLIRSAVFHAAPPSERRNAHRAVADALQRSGDAERLAWHLAGAALGPDEEAAIALESAARQAEQRSSYAAAAAALERAASLTADQDARPRRLQAAADAAFRAGRTEDALTLLREPAEQDRDVLLRAAALRLQGRIAYLAGRPREAGSVLVEASELLEDVDLRLAIEICTEACSAQLGVADAGGVLDAAERARELVERVDDEDLHELVTLTRGWALCYVGRSDEGVPLLEQAVSTGAKLDPLGLMRVSSALEWLDQSREGFGMRAATSRRRARTARSACCRTCSTSRRGTATAPAC